MAQGQSEGLTWGKAIGGIVQVTGLAAATAAIGAALPGGEADLLGDNGLFNLEGEGVTEKAGDLLSNFGDAFGDVWSNIKGAFSTAVDTGKSFFEGITGNADAHQTATSLGQHAENAGNLIHDNPITSAAIGGGAAVGATMLAANGNKSKGGSGGSKVLGQHTQRLAQQRAVAAHLQNGPHSV